MKGILPVACRFVGYALLILSVFVPLLILMFRVVDDGNFDVLKIGMKLSVWLSLFMIFLSKSRHENESTPLLRLKAMKYALYIWGIYYAVMLVNGLVESDMHSADNSIAVVYMIINVLCWEFLLQKARVEKMFRKK